MLLRSCCVHTRDSKFRSFPFEKQLCPTSSTEQKSAHAKTLQRVFRKLSLRSLQAQRIPNCCNSILFPAQTFLWFLFPTATTLPHPESVFPDSKVERSAAFPQLPSDLHSPATLLRGSGAVLS